MIRILFTEPTTPAEKAEWNEWLQTCADAQVALNAAVQDWQQHWSQIPVPAEQAAKKLHLKQKRDAKPDASNKIYAAQKAFFASLDGPFHGKCAYCETLFYMSSPGDIEHFRPKGRLRDYPSGALVKVTVNQFEDDHPGYYWLAYQSDNLLLSCELCNRPTKERGGGELIGKHDFFPVEGNFRAAQPGDEAQETPLLINPLLENPDDHLKIDATGVLGNKTERGRVCIELFGLNQRGLPDARREKYQEVKRLLRELVDEASRDVGSQRSKELLQKLTRIKAGYEPYTMAARLAIADSKEVLQLLLQLMA